jgi:hypothetical protein
MTNASDAPTGPHGPVRELDHRAADDIDVRLFWNPETNGISIIVHDERLGQSLVFDVDGAQALAAFHHPYAFAENRRPARAPTRADGAYRRT